MKVEYVNIVDAETLKEVREIEDKVLVAMAVKLGQTRLIDNIVVDGRK